MKEAWIWKTRCPESGYMVGECGCNYCYQEYVDEDEYADIWSDEEFDWIDEFEIEEALYQDDDEFWEVGITE